MTIMKTVQQFTAVVFVSKSGVTELQQSFPLFTLCCCVSCVANEGRKKKRKRRQVVLIMSRVLRVASTWC